MKQYNLAIVNIAKILLITGLAIITGPLIFYLVAIINDQLIKDNFFVMVLIFLIPMGFFIVWIFTRRFKDVFKVTAIGIESENHGIIKWQEIDKCSWETIKGSIMVYIKLKDSTRLSISESSFKNYSRGYNDFLSFFTEIQDTRDKLPVNERFEISNERISNIFTIFWIVSILGLLITVIVVNMIKK